MPTLFGTPAPDTLTGGDDPDLILGLGAGDLLSGTRGSDTILGGPGDDRIYGDFSNFAPYLPPPGEANLLFGGPGRDTVIAGLSADTVLGDAGDDVLRGGILDSLSSFIEGGASTNWSNDQADLMLGGGGDDLLDGAGGDDTLLGGAGDDALLGSTGADLLAGGPGQDVFLSARNLGVYGGPDTGVGPGLRDVVLDFRQGEDVLDLSRLTIPIAGGPAQAVPGTLFLGEGEFQATFALQVRVAYEGGNTIVQLVSAQRPFDPDAAPEVPAGPEGEIELVGRYHLTEADFVLA